MPPTRYVENELSQKSSLDKNTYRIPPYHYLHVLDLTSNVTRVETGPKTYVQNEKEHVVLGPEKMVIIPPCNYCIILNPVVRNDENALVYDNVGQIKLRHADLEVRLEQDPFPLYPGEVIHTEVTPLTVVLSNTALRLKASRDFDDDTVKRIAGDEWLFEGPGTFVPRKEIEVVETVAAVIINPNQALKLRARTETKDRNGVDRVTGEEWIVKKIGAYLPGAYEEVVDLLNAVILTDKDAVHVKAKKTFVDEFGNTRKSGDHWLITLKDTETYIPGVYEDIVELISITALNKRQYCVILDPLDESGKPRLGSKKLVKGEISFFLQPGEILEAGIQDVYVLDENEGLILRAIEGFEDTSEKDTVNRSPGERWMIKGPVEYIPPIEVVVIAIRFAIVLDENEGIYVRNIKSGKVRLVSGSTYMLSHDEELWVKELPPQIEKLLNEGCDPLGDRGSWRNRSSVVPGPSKSKVRKTEEEAARAVTFRVPHNAAVQIYDFKEKKSRVVFGPDLVMLTPDEQFTLLSISGDKPKRPNVIRTLSLFLGPDFCTDIITVETTDHARLSLQLSYNWHFDVGNKGPEAAAKLFSVPDFIGDLCKAVASRIRGVVAGTDFDDFHKNSAKIIRTAIFGLEDGKVEKSLHFPQNNLYITSVDIQSVEPVDQHTKDCLQKSVQLAIEIATKSREATARLEAEKKELEVRGPLEKQRLSDEVEAKAARKELLELKEAELERLQKAKEIELTFLKQKDELEILKSKEIAEIEVKKITSLIESVGSDTIRSIATAGHDMQVKLLQGLSQQSASVTEEKHPTNFFNTAFLSTQHLNRFSNVKLLQGLSPQSASGTDEKRPTNFFNTVSLSTQHFNQ